MEQNDPTSPNGAPESTAGQAASEKTAWLRRLRFVNATLFLVAAAVTLSTWIAIDIAGGRLVPGTREWSTGGLLSLLSGLIIGLTVKTWKQFAMVVWVPMLVGAFFSLAYVGFANGFTVEIVDQEAAEETTTRRPSGEFQLVQSHVRICEPNEDYYGCLMTYIGVYNSMCVVSQLPDNGIMTCAKLSTFIDEMKETYENCVYGCQTAGDSPWGWGYLTLTEVYEEVSNGDGRPRITHFEECVFDLGPLKLGQCENRGRGEYVQTTNWTQPRSQPGTEN